MIRCSLFFFFFFVFFEFHIIQSPFSANIFPEGDEKMKQKTRLRIRALLLCLAAAVTALPKTAVSAETKKLNDQRKTGYSYYSLLNYYRTDYNRPSRATKGLIDHYEWGDETVYCVNPWMPAAEVSDQYAAQGSIYDWQGITFMQIPQEDGSRVPLVYTPQMIEDIALYAYFGYDYPGHNSEEYYAAAQKLIWERIVQKPVGVYVGNMGCEAVGCGGAPEADLSRQLNEINSLVNAFRNMKISWNMTYEQSHRYKKGTKAENLSDIRKGEVIRVSVPSGLLAHYRFKDVKGITLLDENGNALSQEQLSSEAGMQKLHDTFLIRFDGTGEASFTLRTALMESSPVDIPFLLSSGNAGDQEMIRRGRVKGYDEKRAVFKVKEENIRIHVQKTDASGKSLKGAVLAVFDNANKELFRFESTEQPYEKECTGILVPGGTYVCRELEAPDGYVKASDAQFTIPETVSGTYTAEIKMKDTRISALKTDDTGTPLSGAVLRVIDQSDNSTVDEWTTTDTAHTINHLISGRTYALHETKAPFGYLTAEDIIFTPDDEKDLQLKMIDTRQKIRIRIIKKDAYDPSIPVPNAVFTIFEKGTDEVARTAEGSPAVLITDENGTAEAELSYRPEGYYMKETDVPDGYLNDNADQVYEIVPDADYTFTAEEAFVFEVKNTPDTSVTIVKKDADTGERTQGDASFKDAVYVLKDGRSGKELGTFTIDETGRTGTVIRGLTFSDGRSYILQETKAPEGYQITAGEYRFTITADNLHQIINVSENVKTGRVSVHKVFDASEHSSLTPPEEHASFAVLLKSFAQKYASFEEALAAVHNDPSLLSSKEWDEGETDSSGSWRSRELAYGTYILHQTASSSSDITKLMEDAEFVISGEKEEDVLFHISNKPLRVRLRIVKKDAETGKIITLTPASFILTDETGKRISFRVGASALDSFMTSAKQMPQAEKGVYCDVNEEQGWVTLPSWIDAGHTYRISEVTVPQGYVISSDTEVQLKGMTEAEEDENGNLIVTAEIRNQKAYGTLKLHKKIQNWEEADISLLEKEILKETAFTLYAAEDIIDPLDGTLITPKGEAYGTWHPDENGELCVEKIPLGAYVLKETETPFGLLKDENAYDVIFRQEDHVKEMYVQETEIINHVTKTRFFKKDAAGSEEIPGAEIRLIEKETGEIIDHWISEEKPHCIEGLKAGKTYILEETIVPKTDDESIAYAKAEAIEFTVNDDGIVQDVIMKNGMVLVRKCDIAGHEIKGAKMSVTDEKGNVIDSWTSSVKPHAIRGIEEGKSYVLHEDTSPAGYVKVNDIPFTVETGGKVQTIDVTDAVISFSKQDLGGKELPGAKITVSDQAGNVIDEWISGTEEHRIQNLEEGKTYVLNETAAPDGYYYSESVTFTASRQDQHIVMKDAPVRLKIFKSDEHGEPVEGALLRLFEKDGEELKELSPEEGWLSGREPIEAGHLLKAGGRYILREESHGAGFYDAEDVEFEIPMHAPQEEEVSVIMYDLRTSISVLKTDAAGKPLPGAELAVKDEAGNVVCSWISGSEPYDISSYVKGECTYTVEEIHAPYGYVPAEPLMFTVNGKEHSHQLISVRNLRRKFRLKIFKTDTEGNHPLSGALFAVYNAKDGSPLKDENGNDAAARSGADGSAEFILPYSEDGYFIMEKEAPAGYAISPLRFDVILPADYTFSEGDPILITVRDSEVPKTADTGIARHVVLLVLSLISFAITLREYLKHRA